MSDKIKTSLYLRRKVWQEIKKAAIDAGQTVGEFITKIFTDWRWEHGSANRKPTDPPGSAKNRSD